MTKEDTDRKATGGATDGDDDLEAKAAAGDRTAIAELRHRKLSGYAFERIHGKLVPDANGRVAGDPGYVGREAK